MNLDLIKLTPEAFCQATIPCSEGKRFALARKTMAQVWDECPRGDWLFWILTRLDYERKPLIKLLCNVIIGTPLDDKQTVGDIMPKKSREALKVMERWADGEATEEELKAARKEAAAAYASAYAAYYAAAAYASYYAAAAKKWQADYVRDNVPNPFLSNN